MDNTKQKPAALEPLFSRGDLEILARGIPHLTEERRFAVLERFVAISTIYERKLAARVVPLEVRDAIRTLMIHAAGGHEPPYDAPVHPGEKPTEFYLVDTWLNSLVKGE